MLKIRNVLYPTDFSTHAELALPHALSYAETFGARLHMLHAVVLHAADPNAPGHRFPDVESAYEELHRWAGRRMESDVEEKVGPKLEVTKERRRGVSTAPVILDYADEEEIDLVVMGTHGRRGLRHMLLGSVAEEVLRRASCPVVTVREDGEGRAGEIGTVVVPVDMSEHSYLAFDYGRELAAAYGARVEVLHVIEEAVYPETYEAAPTSPTPDRETVRETLVARLAEGGEDEPPVEVHVDAGRPVPVITDFARDEGADLIVIASHGLTGLKRVLLGSVAERVVRQAPCPVFTVKSFGRDLLSGGGGVEPA